MAWQIEYLNAAKKQLKRLDPQVREWIVHFMGERVARANSPYELGHGLTGKWRAHWRYRVGDYRVICKMEHDKLIVSVVKVGHRSDVYN